jgi:hypothetical protein
MQLSLCKFSRQDNTRLPGEIQLSKDNFKNKFCLINHYDERIDPILHVLKRLLRQEIGSCVSVLNIQRNRTIFAWLFQFTLYFKRSLYESLNMVSGAVSKRLDWIPRFSHISAHFSNAFVSHLLNWLV